MAAGVHLFVWQTKPCDSSAKITRHAYLLFRCLPASVVHSASQIEYDQSWSYLIVSMPERETRLIQMILPRSITYKATLKWHIVQITALLRLKHCLRHHIESTSLKGFKKNFRIFSPYPVLQSGQYHNKDSEQRFSRKNDSDEENCVVRQVSYKRFPGCDRTHCKQIDLKKKKKKMRI